MQDIWETPLINVTLYYDTDDPNLYDNVTYNGSAPVRNVFLGLWDAGNIFLARAMDMINNGPAWVARGGNFTEWGTWRFLHVRPPAYVAAVAYVASDASHMHEYDEPCHVWGVTGMES
jgi:hypothetical protein